MSIRFSVVIHTYNINNINTIIHEQFVQQPSEAEPEHFQCFRKKGLHFIHLNARSQLKKVPELKLIANKTKAAVISVTETWLDDSVTNSEVQIEGYTVIRKDRNRNGGGVCSYIRDDLAFTPLPIQNTTDDYEVLFVELLLPKTKPIVIGTCYRPPNQLNFVERLEHTLGQLRSDCDTFILGDFNINYDDVNCSLFKSYESVLKLFDFTQLIKDPTRVTTTSKSVIDHILCNVGEKVCQSGVISLGLSDHYLTFCTRKSTKCTFNKHNNVKIRSTKEYDKDSFINMLINAKLGNML